MAVDRFELQDLPVHLPEKIDLFVCSASFESRCRSVSDHLGSERVKAVLVAENENHKQLHGDHPAYLMSRYGKKASRLPLDTTDPLMTADTIANALGAYAKLPGIDVVVDITAFTHEALLIFFRLARECLSSASLHCVYASAKEYSVGDSPKRKWLSKGIGEIRSVLGYPGRLVPSRRFHLIVLVGFEHERVAELIRRYEPSLVSLGYPDSKHVDAKKHSATNEYGIETLRAMYGDAREFHFPCYDPAGTRDAINAQKLSAGTDFNVIVAPMNTKISTLGAALAAIADESIQLCYAQAIIYNYLRYSTPGNICYLFRGDM